MPEGIPIPSLREKSMISVIKCNIQIINGFTFNFLRQIVLGDKNIPIFDKYKDIPI